MRNVPGVQVATVALRFVQRYAQQLPILFLFDRVTRRRILACRVENALTQLEMRFVQIGLKDFVNAEILSGLEPGEVVSTGTEIGSETSNETSTESQQPPPGGGFMRILGGQ